jgi:hypothetical protein
MDTKYLDLTPEIKGIDRENRRVTHLISTDSEDRVGDVVEVDGWDTRSYMKNPVVLRDHSYNTDSVIGRAVSVKKTREGLMATTEFAPSEVGQQAFDLVASGFIRAWSVGFRSLDRHSVPDGRKQKCPKCTKRFKDQAARLGKDEGDYFYVSGAHHTKQELLEYSLVAIPMNQDIVMQAIQRGFVSEPNASLFFKVEEPPQPETPGNTAPVEAERDSEAKPRTRLELDMLRDAVAQAHRYAVAQTIEAIGREGKS